MIKNNLKDMTNSYSLCVVNLEDSIQNKYSKDMIKLLQAHWVPYKGLRSVYGWGHQNLSLSSKYTRVTKPQLVNDLCNKGIKKIVTEYQSILILTELGELFALGNNQAGKLGTGGTFENIPTLTKINIPKNKKVIDITMAREHSLALTQDRGLYSCGGWNDCGELGISNIEIRSDQIVNQFTEITALRDKNVDLIYAYSSPNGGIRSSFAITTKGQLYGWGWTYIKGWPETLSTPTLVDNLKDVTLLNSSGTDVQDILLLNKDKSVYTWGRAGGNTPKEIKALKDKNIVDLKVSYMSFYALSEQGIYIWGNLSLSGLGQTQSKRSSLQPLLLSFLPNDERIIQLELGFKAFGLTNKGRVFSWGEYSSISYADFDSREFFEETDRNRDLYRPIEIPSLKNITSLSKGDFPFFAGSLYE